MIEENRKIEKLDTVDLIVRGYEWACPHCGKLNNEIEIIHVVECLECGNHFRTGTADHVWE